MAQTGPIVSAVLAELHGEGAVSGQAVVESELHNDKTNSEHLESNKAITHHYKITKTQTVEIDDSVEAKDEADLENANASAKQTKRKKGCGCFSFLKR